MSEIPTGPEFGEALALALALPFIPVGVATLLPLAASVASFAGFLLF